MNKKVQKIAEPGLRLYLMVLVLFAAVTVFFNYRLAIGEGVLILALLLYSLVSGRRRRRELMKYIESVTYDAESAKNNTLLNFPLPMVVFRLDDNQIIWGNQSFFQICGVARPSIEARISELVEGFSGKWMMEGKSQHPGLIEVGGRKYQVHGNLIRGSEDKLTASGGYMGITYWVDVTEYDDIRLEYNDSRPVVALIVFDNYEEFMKNLTDRQRVELRGQVDDLVAKWGADMDGFLQRVDRDRYVFFFEARYLPRLIDERFALLEDMHALVSPRGIRATASIGLGRDGTGIGENYENARLSLEMALSRGGDQAVMKNRYSFEFFGGRGAEVETRTKVKSRVMASAFNELVRDASQVFIMGHRYGDMDCIGGAVGVCCIARLHGTPAFVVIDMENNAAGKLIAQLRQMPEYKDAFISPTEAMLRADGRSLLVVVDVSRPEQVEDQGLLMACNRVALIDHHRRTTSYIDKADLTFHEPYASSVSELVGEILQEAPETVPLSRREAEALLAGMMMDTKNFTIRAGERTFEVAAFLRRAGADPSEVKKLLQSDMEDTVAKYAILQRARLYRNTLAIAAPETPQDRTVAAQAADELLNIEGVEASIVLYPTAEGGVSISARSIGQVNVQVLLEKLGGGGNRSAAGAQLSGISLRQAVNDLFRAIDAYYNEEAGADTGG